jgi:hypothetical protein
MGTKLLLRNVGNALTWTFGRHESHVPSERTFIRQWFMAQGRARDIDTSMFIQLLLATPHACADQDEQAALLSVTYCIRQLWRTIVKMRFDLSMQADYGSLVQGDVKRRF